MKYLASIIFTIAILLTGCDGSMIDDKEQNSLRTDSVSVNTTSPSSDSLEADPLEAEYLIIPGESIGKIALGMNPYEVEKKLGEPDLQDAAMGKAWLTWRGERDMHNNETALNIYVAFKDNSMKEKVVKQVRVTSSAFHTADSMRVYASMEQIRNHFPEIEAVGEYKSDGRTFTVYDAIQKGIAFDFVEANGQYISTAISVHTPGVAVNKTYIHLQRDE